MGRTRVEDLYILQPFCLIESRNGLAIRERPRISARGKYDADRRVRRPTQPFGGQCALGYGLAYLYEVAFQPEQNGLRLWIAESAIELEHHGAARRHHQSNVEDSLVGDAFGAQAVDHGLGDVVHDPLAHRVAQKIVARICPHTSGIRTGIAVTDALVIARGY